MASYSASNRVAGVGWLGSATGWLGSDCRARRCLQINSPDNPPPATIALKETVMRFAAASIDLPFHNVFQDVNRKLDASQNAPTGQNLKAQGQAYSRRPGFESPTKTPRTIGLLLSAKAEGLERGTTIRPIMSCRGRS
jgi:hypothetical protein